MRLTAFSLLLILCSLLVASPDKLNAQFNQWLDDAFVVTKEVDAEDIVYDHVRDLLYVSLDGFPNSKYSNSLLIVDPATLNVLDSLFVGEEPDTLEITEDCSRLYIGFDAGFRYWSPSTFELSSMFPTFNASGFLDSPSSFGFSSDGVVFVSSRNLSAFDDAGFISDADESSVVNVVVVDSQTLFTTDANTTTTTTRWHFDGRSFVEEASASGVASGFRMEYDASVNRVRSGRGIVLDPLSFATYGTFPVSPNGVTTATEYIEPSGTTYFLDNGNLRLFDDQTFLQLDSEFLGFEVSSSVQRLVSAGKDRLAYIGFGQIGVISKIPVAVATADRGADLNGDGRHDFSDVEFFVDLMVRGEYQSIADFNRDFTVNQKDIDGFVDEFLH